MESMFSRVVSGLIGAGIGALCSLLVNSTLIEVSINTVFSIYFGVIFAGIGLLVLWRTYNENQKNESTIVRRPTDTFFAHPGMLYTFSSLMIFSGLICFLLRKDWFTEINYLLKIPFFTTLGVSFSFIIILLFADCLNYCAASCGRGPARPIIDSNQQIYLVAALAVIMGFLYGFIFGILDLEDANLYKLAILAMKEESYCYPIGIILGGIAGFLNEIMRERGGELVPTDNKFSQEI